MPSSVFEFPEKKYQVIYADPPWKFAPMGISPDKIHKELASHSAAESHYKTMDLEDIRSLPVKAIADKSSVLFLWATSPFLEKALEVISCWGFKFKTVAFVWAKQNKNGTGFAHAGGWYTLSQTELCLLATKGKTLKRVSRNQKQLIVCPRTKHSEKPDEARERINTIYGDVPRIELFARKISCGWDVWGDEIGRSPGDSV